MLKNEQLITCQCDVCGEVHIFKEDIPIHGMYLIPVLPDKWYLISDRLLICPKHVSVSMTFDKEGLISVEDNSSF